MKFDFTRFAFTETDADRARTALIGTDRRLTWGQLYDEVEGLAAELRRRCTTGGSVVVYGHKEAGMVTAILACLRAGVPYVPVDVIVPKARVATIRQVAGTAFVLNAGAAIVEDAANLSVPALEPGGRATAEPAARVGANDLAYVIFTSGSTGEPKGVQITRANVANLAAWVGSADFGFTPDDVMMSQCSFSFDVSFFDVIAALGAGGTLALCAPNELKNPRPYAELAVAPTSWSSTPSFLSLALTAPGFTAEHFPTLRRFYVAGEAVHAALAERLWRRFPAAEFWNAYGPTEATVITTLVRVTPELIAAYPSVPIGRVKPGVRMPTSAADQTSEGELSIVGENVSPGYLNRPDLNATRFSGTGAARAYLTGDLGFHRDGLVFYQGRIDSQIKLHGYRIELDEIDNHVGGLSTVEAAATIGLRRGGEVKKLVCFVQPRPGVSHEGLIEGVRAVLSDRLPYYMVPAEFRVIDTMPYNTNHKIDRGALVRQLEG